MDSEKNILPNAVEVTELLTSFDHLGGDDVLDRAIRDCIKALGSSAVLSDPAVACMWKMHHATSLYLRFERDGDDDDIRKSQQIFESLASESNHDPSVRTHALYGLGRVFEAQNDYYGSADTLQKSHAFLQQAMDSALSNTTPCHLLDEIAVHLGRQRRVHIKEDIARYERNVFEAISIISEVTDRIEDGNRLKPFALAYLSSGYSHAHSATGGRNKDYIIKSEELAREALRLGPHHRHRSRFLHMLAQACKGWGTPDRLQECICIAKEALELLKMPIRTMIDKTIISTLGYALSNLYHMKGQLADLDSAISYCQDVVTTSEHPTRPVLNNLCLLLRYRFEATGRLIDIDRAIEVGSRALQLMPIRNDAYTSYYLGSAHLMRFSSSGERDDFEAGQHHLQTGIMEFAGTSLFPYYLLYMAKLYNANFDISGEHTNLDRAIQYGSQAVEVTRTTEQGRISLFISEHGSILLKRFEMRRNPQDLIDSLAMHENALSQASSAFPEYHQFLARYSRALRRRFELFNDPRDINRAIEMLQEALNYSLTERNPHQSAYLEEMAALHFACYSFRSLPTELNQCLEYYSKAAQFQEGFISDRFRAAVTGAKIAQEHGRVLQSCELFSAAVALLPRMAWLGFDASMRHAKLVQTASLLPCDAAAAAIKAGNLERAVELLDEGRSVVWRSILELRTDLKELESVAPELARELLEVGKMLELSDMGSTQVSKGQMEQRAARRRRAAERWDDLVTIVRGLHNFNSFLKPLDFSTLRQASRDGPCVLINVSDYGSDAIIISYGEPVRVISLPRLDLGTVRRLGYILTQAIHIHKDKEGHNVLERVLLDISRQLWHGGMHSVADALCESQDRDSRRHDRLRRVWWIPTGFLSLLPIHCAGPYAAGLPGIPDLFISSYTTTLSALLTARKPRTTASSPRMLAIGVPETSGYPHLRHANKEMEIVSQLSSFKSSLKSLYGPDATLESVTRALPEYSWIHACCHGHWSAEHPLDSAFILVDGSLDLPRIVRMHLQDAEFAFLSACHTARQTAFVPDESLHLVAAMQIAGFKGLLGTAWSMADCDGPQLARQFYHWITVNDRYPDARNAAEALHWAIRDMRRKGVPLYRWAAFVHIGI